MSVDLSNEIDYISLGKRQICSYLKYHIQDGSQQGRVCCTFSALTFDWHREQCLNLAVR